MRLILIFIYLLSIVNSYSQTAFNVHFDNDTLRDGGMAVATSKNGGYLIGGSTHNSYTGFNASFIIKTDCNGDTIWTKILDLSSTGGDMIYELIELSNGDIVCCGTFQDPAVLNSDFFLMKLDPVGNQKWFRQYGGTEYDLCWDMVVTQDNGYALFGVTGNTSNGDGDFYLVKTDSSGILLWDSTYGGGQEEVGLSINNTDDVGFILSGRTNSFGAGQFDLYMVKVDSSGIMEWQQTYGGTGSEGGGGAKQTLDGGYIIVGNIDMGSNSLDCYIVKTDSVGNIIWDNIIGYPGDGESFSDIQILPNGNYIAVGSIQTSNTVNIDGWLMLIDSVGDTLWTTTFGDTGIDDYIYDIELTDDGGYVMTGVWHNGNLLSNPNMWLIKTDSLGCDSAACNMSCTVDCGYIRADFSISSDTLYFTDDSLSVQFIDSSLLAQSWQWDFGDGKTDTLQNPIHEFDSAGTYTIELVAGYGNCTDTAWGTVTVIDNCASHSVSITSAPDTLYYTNGLNGSFNASPGMGDQWLWNFGDGDTSGTINPSHTFETAGIFSIYFTASKGFCTDTAWHTVTVIDDCGNVTAGAIDDTLYYSDGNLSVQFLGNTWFGSQWQWQLGDGDSTTILNPVHTYDTAGIYNAFLAASDGACYDTARQTIVIINNCDQLNPVATASPDTVYLNASGEVQFSGSYNIAQNWQWNFGDGDSSVVLDPVHEYISVGSYEVAFVVNSGLCTDTAFVNVVVELDNANPDRVGNPVKVLIVYPNPTNGELHIKISTENPNCALVIQDIQGREVYNSQLEKSLVSIPTEAWEKGVYLISLIREGKAIEKARVVVK